MSASLTGQPKANSSRVEFFLHNWTSTTSGALVQISAVGFTSYWSSGAIEMYNTWTSGGTVCRVDVTSLAAANGVYVRYQHDIANSWDICEAWTPNGTQLLTTRHFRWTSGGTGTGTAGASVTASNTKVAWVRVLSTLVEPNYQMPVTKSTETRLLEWRLDGNLTDDSGNGWTGSGTSITYSASPTPALLSRIRTYRTPYRTSYSGYSAIYATPWWAEWISLRAGDANQLDGTMSSSQLDTPGTITYFWQQLSGPSTLRWSDRTVGQPVVYDAVFGTYRIQLTVGDGTNTTTTTIDIGAVAHTDSGVVIQSKSAADTLFGPMIAFGRSSWGLLDERAQKMRAVQPAFIASGGFDGTTPSWDTNNSSGTVAFRKNSSSGTSTTLSAGITATDLSIPITDASQLDLSSFPTFVQVGSASSWETILVTATTATSGAATLTVAFGGRGISGVATYWTILAAQAHSSGTAIRTMNVVGTSTSFSADATHPVCPAGVPGPPGTVAYSTGTLTMSGTTATGSGTTWNTANGVVAGNYIRISATHSSGTPFIWWARISSVDSTTQLTLEKAMPSGTDSASFSYKITSHNPGTSTQVSFSLSLQQDDGRDLWLPFNTLGCASDTRASVFNLVEASWITTASFSSRNYSLVVGQSPGTEFGPNFYGSGLALRSDYYRSGYTASKTVADGIDDYWTRHPYIQSGNFILRLGGGLIGATACVVLGDCSRVEWRDLRRQMIGFRMTSTTNCDGSDLRDKGYSTALLALGALYDPTESATLTTYLDTNKTHMTNCSRSGTYSSGAYWNNSGPLISLTNGSTAGTGTGLASSICRATATGTATATNGSGALTGSGFVSGGSAIILTGTISGSTQSIRCGYTYGSSSAITLSCLWPGDTGTVDWMIESSAYFTSYGTANDDANLAYNYGCTWNSSTSITLHRAWRGTTGSYRPYEGNLSGRGTQPFMAGISALAATWAAGIAAQASAWNTVSSEHGSWYLSKGYDSGTRQQYYGREFEFCEPKGSTYNPSGTGGVIPGCIEGYGSSSDRMTIGEAISALGPVLYSASASNLTFVDDVFSALWGGGPYGGGTSGDYWSAGWIPQVWNLADASLAYYKWSGFFFGVGQAHRWPAVRAGGIPTTDNRTYSISCILPTSIYSSAAKLRLTLTAPSGASTSTTSSCASPTVSVTIDRRFGVGTNYLMTLSYLTSGDVVISTSDPISVVVQ